MKLLPPDSSGPQLLPIRPVEVRVVLDQYRLLQSTTAILHISKDLPRPLKGPTYIYTENCFKCQALTATSLVCNDASGKLHGGNGRPHCQVIRVTGRVQRAHTVER